MDKPLAIGIIGCGAVSDLFHLPAILSRKDVRLTSAVDPNAARAQLIAQKTGAQAFSSVQQALPFFDAAIVALPHNLHAAVSVELLEAGKHVLVEKPLAMNAAECDLMIAAAAKGNASLAVGQMRRFNPAVSAGKALLDRGVLGLIERFKICEGSVFEWPVTSNYLLRKETAGGGVLADTGAHTLDMILWLFGEAAELDYRDDSYGGVEADCELHLKMANGINGYVELSRTRNLPTELVIRGSEGEMAINYRENRISLRLEGQEAYRMTLPSQSEGGSEASIWHYMIALQLDNWINALASGKPALVSGVEGRRAVALIEKCYRERKPLDFPWVRMGAGK